MLNYKSKHVFGPEANVDGALSIGKIDPFDILFLDEGKIGWITENGEKFIIDDKKQVRIESELPSVGEENVLFVCKESLYIWNGSEYILIVDDYATLKDRVSNLENSIAANTSAIELLTNGTSAEEVDSVNDLIQYVNEHGSEVTGMKADIKANTDAIAAICPENSSYHSLKDVEDDIDELYENVLYKDADTYSLKTVAQGIVPAINEVHDEVEAIKDGTVIDSFADVESIFEILENTLREHLFIDYTKVEFDVTELVSSAHIYGVSWDRTDTPVLTRIDEAASFHSPVVAVDTSVGSSPFDNLMPWAGMEKITDENGQSLVSIPRFWYRWTSTEDALALQIADAPVNGFHVSPMHADRGDGKGERDVAYIGRYHCDGVRGSITGIIPTTNVTRAQVRASISSTAAGYYQQDFAAWWTIRMLFLVEHATWDGQAVIGEGNISGSIVKNGATDNMIYHTGMVTEANGNAGNQYRWIENPWSNVGEWVDGITFDGANIYIFNNPTQMSDDVTAEGAVKLSYQRSYNDDGEVVGWIQDWGIPENEGLEYAMYPTILSDVDFEYPHYVQDACGALSGGAVLVSGGNCVSVPSFGPFVCNGVYGASESVPYVGARLQKLP